ncbi:MAG: hypothetical protein IIC26_06880, partial [Chloroflexi bacterium]|nr:hypothetical protein [Chloroflexota bacterium]
VTIVHRRAILLREEDEQVAQRFTEVYQRRFNLLLNAQVSRAYLRGSEIAVELGAGGVGTIVTWGVETAEAARRVLACGVSGVTSDSLALLASVRGGELSPSQS